jgi:rhodanese-related sulfurtransferase
MSNVRLYPTAAPEIAVDFFRAKLGFETDCSDVYADIKAGQQTFVLLDVRSKEAFVKSHAITAIHFPHGDMNAETLKIYPKETQFVVYCWGPGCNGATKAALTLATLGFAVKEMIGGIHYWEDFERYPVIRHQISAQT